MRRKEVKDNQIFRFASDKELVWRCAYTGDCTSSNFPHPPNPAEWWSNTKSSSRLDDEVVLWTPPSKEVSVTSLPHYTGHAVEAIDVIEDWGLGFRLANVIKYIARHGKKPGQDAKDDLRKARAYLSREIAALEGRKAWE